MGEIHTVSMVECAPDHKMKVGMSVWENINVLLLSSRLMHTKAVA